MSQVSWFCWFSGIVFDPYRSYNPSSLFSAGFLESVYYLAVGLLHLFSSVPRWKLSVDNLVRDQSMSITERSFHWFSCQSYLVVIQVSDLSILWVLRYYQGWDPFPCPGFQARADIHWTLSNFCAAYTLAHLVDGTSCRLKIMWLDWCPSPYIGSLAW